MRLARQPGTSFRRVARRASRAVARQSRARDRRGRPHGRSRLPRCCCSSGSSAPRTSPPRSPTSSACRSSTSSTRRSTRTRPTLITAETARQLARAAGRLRGHELIVAFAEPADDDAVAAIGSATDVRDHPRGRRPSRSSLTAIDMIYGPAPGAVDGDGRHDGRGGDRPRRPARRHPHQRPARRS